MSGYGINRWTCGECGDSFEASGVVGDLKVQRWMRDHKEQHRLDRLPPEERSREIEARCMALLHSIGKSATKS